MESEFLAVLPDPDLRRLPIQRPIGRPETSHHIKIL